MSPIKRDVKKKLLPRLEATYRLPHSRGLRHTLKRSILAEPKAHA